MYGCSLLRQVIKAAESRAQERLIAALTRTIRAL
jgi:hypothetical protein